MDARRDEGAAAVEFAIVSVLLFTILFGMIQYGYAFFQIQGAQSTAEQSVRLASLGIPDCDNGGDPLANSAPPNFVAGVLKAADNSGLGGARVTAVDLSWTGGAGSDAARGKNAVVKITYTPFRIGMPLLIPFPGGDFTALAQARVEDLGDWTAACSWTRP